VAHELFVPGSESLLLRNRAGASLGAAFVQPGDSVPGLPFQV